jgi:Ca2+-binding RTX toxin-like protein
VQFKAQPGAANKLTIQKVGKDLRFTDPAGVNAGQGCERENPADTTTVICKLAGQDSYATDIDLGDGDDTLKVIEAPEGAGPTYKGGAGNDRIEGGNEHSTIEGGEGDDTIIGAGGVDTLKGEAGNDKLDGGPGLDTLDAGAGNDSIESRDGSYRTGRNDVIGEQPVCGAGKDTLTADVGDLPHGSCDVISKADTKPAAKGTLQITSGGTYKLAGKTPGFDIKVKCVGGPCEGRAYFYTGKGYIFPFNASKGAFKLAAGQTGTQRIAFGNGYRSFRESVGRKGRIKAYIATLVGDAEGRTKTVRKSITLTARKGLR